MRCHYISVESACDGTINDDTGKPFVPEEFDGPIWIPGCIGGSVYGKNGCTCYKPIAKEKTKREQAIDNLENECMRLRSINDSLNRKYKKLKEENLELLRAGLPLSLRRKIYGDKTYLWAFLKKLTE